MALIDVDDAQGWLDNGKLTLGSLDSSLADQASTHVIARLASVYNTALWLTPVATPKLVRSAIAMYYAGWLFIRTYSEDSNEYGYGLQLIRSSDALLDGVVSGAIDLIEVEEPIGSTSGPSFYPTDASSSVPPTREDPSLGPAVFSMGRVF